MADDEDQQLLRQIDRRVRWIAHTVIGSVAFVVYFYVEHMKELSDVWGLSEDGAFWVGVGAAVVVAGILEASFNRS